MLFDPRPKRRRADLFDFDEEYNALRGFLGEPLVVVLGLRRTGKTSLILTTLEESKAPYILVDLRGVTRSWRDLYQALSTGMSGFLAKVSVLGGFQERLRRLLGLVRGVSISGFTIEFSWGRERPSLTSLLEAIDEAAGEHGVRVTVVFDEVQRAVGNMLSAIQSAIAYAYDNLRNVSFILSGSEMGLVHGILSNPESPLYGRAHLEVRTRRLSRGESLEFLERGFGEVNYRVPRGELEEVVDRLDGIVGWLTYYGYLRVHGNRGLGDVLREAVNMARGELEDFLATRVSGVRYRRVLRLLAQGVRDWGLLKSRLEEAEGRAISDRVLHDILHSLREHSIIDEGNNFLDPLCREAAATL